MAIEVIGDIRDITGLIHPIEFYALQYMPTLEGQQFGTLYMLIKDTSGVMDRLRVMQFSEWRLPRVPLVVMNKSVILLGVRFVSVGYSSAGPRIRFSFY